MMRQTVRKMLQEVVGILPTIRGSWPAFSEREKQELVDEMVATIKRAGYSPRLRRLTEGELRLQR